MAVNKKGNINKTKLKTRSLSFLPLISKKNKRESVLKDNKVNEIHPVHVFTFQNR